MGKLKKISAIGTTKLRCMVCNGTEFWSKEGETLTLEDLIPCAGCGAISVAQDFADKDALDDVVQQVLARAKKK
ncbi:hypothetical protein ABL840_09055 [Variovorax sp. NFACC27]|uniref:hypothetical protein n=1 Tax=unclassified Variovorax TaxID=663243 RepID=UPI0008975B5E|nr:hypothetical protein SAMN03159371_05286 [Variovorax sp. NFACC28]SEG89595.1 hypothetical protein SAMN03159365_05161 [Variovorax sp. NFACC29]SFD40605.1 hypothetical protein SAMN03159379_05176 [Variovorax sp. NFACC26]SFG42806.1 hypothetical protein SAMN03159447_03286 [Variovorax sp. NFACC27]